MLGIRDDLRQLGKHLAAIANAQTEGVWSCKEGLELVGADLELGAVQDDVVRIAQAIAQLRGIDVDVLARATSANVRRVLKLDPAR